MHSPEYRPTQPRRAPLRRSASRAAHVAPAPRARASWPRLPGPGPPASWRPCAWGAGWRPRRALPPVLCRRSSLAWAEVRGRTNRPPLWSPRVTRRGFKPRSSVLQPTRARLRPLHRPLTPVPRRRPRRRRQRRLPPRRRLRRPRRRLRRPLLLPIRSSMWPRLRRARAVAAPLPVRAGAARRSRRSSGRDPGASELAGNRWRRSGGGGADGSSHGVRGRADLRGRPVRSAEPRSRGRRP